jgi:hypothetical protein
LTVRADNRSVRGERVAVLAAAAAVVLVAGGAAVLRSAAGDEPVAGAEASTVVSVVCSPDGITLSDET